MEHAAKHFSSEKACSVRRKKKKKKKRKINTLDSSTEGEKNVANIVPDSSAGSSKLNERGATRRYVYGERRVKVLLFDALIAGFLSCRRFLSGPLVSWRGSRGSGCLSLAENWSTVKRRIIVIMRHHVKRIPVGPPEPTASPAYNY